MKVNIKNEWTLLLLLTFCGTLSAQTGVGNEEVIIIKEHQANVKDANKES